MAEVRHVFRWDLDKTYLKTEFETVRDLVRIARLTAEERENIPGSAALLRAIKASTPEPEAHGVYFLSGSPDLIRAVIEKKFSLDGFQPDGFALKPTLSDVLRGRFRAVRGQVAYKLAHLLHGRSEIPVGTPETLFGDDAENDAFIYSLYSDAVEGTVSQQTVLEVVESAGAYPDQLDAIREGLESIVHEPAVDRVLIHLDQMTPHSVFRPFFPRVVPISNHLQTAIVLVLDGTLPAEVVRLVAQELIDRYRFDGARLIELSEDILRRRRPYSSTATIAEFASALRALDPARPPPGDPNEHSVSVGSVEVTAETLSRIAETAAHVAEEGGEAPVEADPIETRDYVALWAAEVERAETLRRQRREASRPAPRTDAPAPNASHEYARAVAEVASSDESRTSPAIEERVP